ncbi:hypothetical protein BDP27DRAFT_1420491 [Rhodocollybia butyracea]|uniref:Uncharacterized protein n=1 Tax=Rhodocollybia butyracea TaxID=206335 RepID=A0A9P5U9I3_9AGAR|nr:hypothetical protein BDP27DRAFT_1420491 [Rhodocollybia butyracea]
MATEEQEILALLATACYQNMAALIVTGIGFGASLLGTLIAVKLLNVRSWRQASAVLLLCCVVLFICSIWEIVYSSVLTLLQMCKTSLWYLSLLESMGSTTYDRFWRFTLALLMLGDIAINIADAGFDITIVASELVNGQTVVLDWLSVAMTLSVNLLATSLIGWKASPSNIESSLGKGYKKLLSRKFYFFWLNPG